jgi:hypothetical protein
MAAAGTAAYAAGRSDIQEDMTPTRAVQQIKQDIATTKEHLT